MFIELSSPIDSSNSRSKKLDQKYAQDSYYNRCKDSKKKHISYFSSNYGDFSGNYIFLIQIVYRCKWNSNNGETESDRCRICGVGASWIPSGACCAKYKGCAKNLDYNSLRDTDSRMHNGYTMSNCRVWTSIIEQFGWSYRLFH